MAVLRLPIKITSPVAGVCNNTWHVRLANDTVADQPQLDAAVSALRTFYTATLLQQAPTGVTLEADAAINVDTAKDMPVTWAKMTASTVTTMSPTFLAICVNWKTDSRTRRGRGRTFLGPLVNSAQQTDGTIMDAIVASMTTAANALVAASKATNGWAFGVYGLVEPSKISGIPLDGNPPRMFRDFTGCAVSDRFAYLSSRRP